MKHRLVFLLCVSVLLVACGAPETVVVTQEVTREVEVTRLVVETPAGDEPRATFTPFPTYTPYPTLTPYPTFTPSPTPMATATSSPTAAPTATPTATPTLAPTETATPAPTASPTSAAPRSTPTPAIPPTPAMQRLEDRDPGPPFSIAISANRALENSVYKVTGFVRNDGTEVYENIGVVVTFYDDEGFRHGPLEADCPFILLAPGEQSPFSIQVAARRVVSFLAHPNGRPTGRQSAPVLLSSLSMFYGGDSVRITGLASNGNEFKIKNVVVAGALYDASGQMVSLGSTFLLQEDILPGSGVWFDLRIEYVPFVRYQLYAQAERDWE